MFQVLSQEEKHTLQNKTIDPKRANPKGRFQEPTIKKIYVAKVDPSVTEDQIKEYFSQWGEVSETKNYYLILFILVYPRGYTGVSLVGGLSIADLLSGTYL